MHPSIVREVKDLVLPTSPPRCDVETITAILELSIMAERELTVCSEQRSKRAWVNNGRLAGQGRAHGFRSCSEQCGDVFERSSGSLRLTQCARGGIALMVKDQSTTCVFERQVSLGVRVPIVLEIGTGVDIDSNAVGAAFTLYQNVSGCYHPQAAQFLETSSLLRWLRRHSAPTRRETIRCWRPCFNQDIERADSFHGRCVESALGFALGPGSKMGIMLLSSRSVD